MIKFRTTVSTIAAVAALAVVASTSASAYNSSSGTPEQRQACTSDAMNYCMSSSIDKIVACLKTDKRVSKACKKAMGRH